jgi:Signal transduction histidine kinase
MRIMHTKYPMRFFRQLSGKLMLSYTLTSVVAFLFIEVIAIAIVFWFISQNIPDIALKNLTQDAPETAPYLINGSPDSKALTDWLHTVNTTVVGPFDNYPDFISVVDAQGGTIASSGKYPIPVHTAIQAQLSPQNRANLHKVLSGGKDATGMLGQNADGTLVAIVPVMGDKGNVLGALIMKISQPNMLKLIPAFFHLIIATVIIVTIIAGITGLVFGYLNARGITHRLQALSIAAERWSRGDFSALTQDTSKDELGQLAGQLNRMAEQLQNLLQARQALATVEERNRLARDLHDSVKQQIFAVAMQIGATQSLLKRDPAAAEVRLQEARKLVNQTQQELTSLISELRPVALNGKSITTALRELTTRWTQQTGIVATLHAESHEPLPHVVEEALFRVTQEALSNVARHSKASLAQMDLTTTNDIVTLAITDNGQGFDTTHRDGPGFGLHSMRERMKALGGDVQCESAPGKGTCIIARCKRLSISTSDTAPHSDYSQDNMERTQI